MSACLCVVFEQRACLIVNFNAGQSWMASHGVRLSSFLTMDRHPFWRTSTVKLQKAWSIRRKVTPDFPQRDRV